ncbi:MAG: EAL domain-containing protein [Gammaproteobacteria bacterium]|nr:EAL domain-containing protein [Gammaproteobacteria bacterium]
MKLIKKILANSSIRHQLFVMVSTGIILMITTSTLTSTWITNKQLSEILLNEGLKHTNNLASNSLLALLYSSPENANNAIETTLLFNGVDSVAIYDRSFKQFIHGGKDLLPKVLNLGKEVHDKPKILYEDSTHWHFLAPITTSKHSNEIDQQLFKHESQQELMGYAYVLLNKDVLDEIKTNLLLNNTGIAFIVSIILLILLHLIIKSLTQPLKYISEVMKKTEQGELGTQVDVRGPTEIQHIINTYNHMIGVISDRDEKLRNHNIQLEKKVTLDHLTGIMNRVGFEDALANAYNEPVEKNGNHILCFLDLDRFKIINDNCGHSAGDELLVEICRLFKKTTRQDTDILARIGGDEFALILKNCSIEKAIEITNNICQTVKDYQFHWNRKQYSIGVSIGATPIDKNTGSLKEILERVDTACHIAKENGRGQVHVYIPNNNDNINISHQKSVINIIKDALSNNSFELFIQKIEPLKTLGTHKNSYEILIRLADTEGNYKNSTNILEIAKRHNLSSTIDKWVIEKTFELFRSNSLLQSADMCTINITEDSMNDDEFIDYIKSNLARHNITPDKICFESSEISTIGNLNKAKLFIDKLHKTGCHFSMDNFGGSTLSFEYLKQLGADFLKIEGVLIKSSTTDSVSHAMVKAINEIAHILNIKTVASLVETDALLDHISDLGFDYAQGFAIDEPESLMNTKIK